MGSSVGFARNGRLDSEPAQALLLDLIEKNRTLWFEIGTQFRALFCSDDGTGNDTSELVLSTWLVNRIESFISLLHAHISTVNDGSALRDVLEAAMFFGASLGRLGADFRPLLVPIFEQSLFTFVVSRWENAEAELAAALGLKKSLGSVLPLYAPASRRADDPPRVGSTAPQDPNEPPEPPHSTLAFPVLAHILNVHLDTLNDLRQCAPLSLRDRLEARLKSTLVNMAKLFARHTEAAAGSPTDAQVSELLWREAGEVTLPHLCLAFVFVFEGASCTESSRRLRRDLHSAFASVGLALSKEVNAIRPIITLHLFIG